MATSSTPLKKGYKYRIYPTAVQKEQLAGLFGANRFLWNLLINQTEKAYQVYHTCVKQDYPADTFFKITDDHLQGWHKETVQEYDLWAFRIYTRPNS
jgi:transposase